MSDIIADYYNKKFCIPVYSGTLAIEAILKTLNTDSNTKVLISSVSCYSILESVLNAGLTPVIATPENGMLFSVHELDKIIRDERISIYIAVHQYGYYQNLPNIEDLIVIEDYSQAWNLKQVDATFDYDRHFIVQSLGSTKPLSNDIGGLIITNEDIIKCFDLKTKEDRYKNSVLLEYYYPLEINYNFMIRKANKKVKFQRKNAFLFENIFTNCPGVTIFDSGKYASSYHRYVIGVNKKDKDKIVKIMDACQIKYQLEYKIKLDELPLTKNNKVKIIKRTNDLSFILLRTNNSLRKIKKFGKRMEKEYGNKT